MEEMEEELIEDLTIELSISDADFNTDLLTQKVKNALREVKTARNYPASYTDDMIDADLKRYYSQTRSIALYDYNKVGADFEDSHSENGISYSFSERDKLFAGIIPLARS